MGTIIGQLKTARQKKGLRQSELGKKLGLPQSHISSIERGVTDPRLSTMADMAWVKPSSTAVRVARPAMSSSRMRSKISTLASTAMPIESAKPANPGSVSVNPRPARPPSA